MEWIRTDCYTPGCGKQQEDTGRRKRCRLHKPIRNKDWPDVLNLVRIAPRDVCEMNGYGWNSLTLAIYHGAPIEVISEMLSCLSAKERVEVLSSAVPNGCRLCLHFAARYIDNVETFKLLTENYPPALLHVSNDGVSPLQRAIYYRKDREILEYLDSATRKERDRQELRKYNNKLRRTVVQCCEHQLRKNNDPSGAPLSVKFVVDLYLFSNEREMIGLFLNVLSYVGIESIPLSTTNTLS